MAVKDEPAILQIYSEILGDEGFQVTTQLVAVTEPTEVVALTPDLLVLDPMMGRLDRGTAFLGLLRADPRTSGLSIVVCTAAAEPDEQLAPQVAAWGVTVVAKPFDINAFVAAVRSKLGP